MSFFAGKDGEIFTDKNYLMISVKKYGIIDENIL